MRSKCKRMGCLSPAVHRGYCDTHSNSMKTTTMVAEQRSDGQEMYRSALWKRLRKSTMMKYPLCVRCLSYGLTRKTEHIDHVIPHRGNSQLFTDTSNLQGLCHSCHSYKTNRERKGHFDDYR